MSTAPETTALRFLLSNSRLRARCAQRAERKFGPFRRTPRGCAELALTFAKSRTLPGQAMRKMAAIGDAPVRSSRARDRAGKRLRGRHCTRQPDNRRPKAGPELPHLRCGWYRNLVHPFHCHARPHRARHGRHLGAAHDCPPTKEIRRMERSIRRTSLILALEIAGSPEPAWAGVGEAFLTSPLTMPLRSRP